MSYTVHHSVFDFSKHRRTSQGAGGLQPPDSGKTTIFRAKANFFGQKLAAKNEKKIVFIKRKKRIYSVSRDKVPEIRDFY